jgi:hypothetical protein
MSGEESLAQVYREIEHPRLAKSMENVRRFSISLLNSAADLGRY